MCSHLYRCLDCGHESLESTDHGHLCPACGKLWPTYGGVSHFLAGLKVGDSGISLPEDAWKAVCQSTGLAHLPENVRQLKEIFARNYQLPEFHLCAENNYYFQRVPALEKFDSLKDKFDSSKDKAHSESPTKTGSNKQLTDTKIRFRVERHLIPECVPAGQTHTWNVRIVNDGGHAFSSKGNHPVRLAHRWRDGAGYLLPVECRPTTLPIALAPGRALTVPMLLQSPSKPGLHLLEIGLVDEKGQWNPAEGFSSLVQSVPGLSLEIPSHWTTLDKPQSSYNYVEDHNLGVAFLKEELQGKSSPRLLEVGGCCVPMTSDLDGEIFVSDIDAQTLQIGRMRYANKPQMNFLASDAARLPFASGTFDGVVLFATLHHFADPIACLREFRRVIKPDGFVMMGTEPIGSYMAETVDAKLLKELESGINEQVFTALEYQRMFLSAGLFATRVEIDRGALRAILRPEASGVPFSSVRDHFANSFLLRQWVKLNLQWARQKVKKIGSVLTGRKAG